MRLATETLGQLDGVVSVPGYDRSRVKPSILHIGVGNFHRAHQAFYTHELLNQGGDPEWGIRGAGVRPEDNAMRARLESQNWLSTVVETDGTNLKAAICGAMVDFLPVEPGHGPIINAIADPVTKIVSLTITEGGYYIDAATGQFDATHPDIQADIKTPERPVSVFGAILAGLEKRRAANAPVTVMSCDNLPGNGDLTASVVKTLAGLSNPALGEWIADNVSFPNSMVDRITPATSPREIALLKERFGIEDNAPVFCEPFRQWVLEDDFKAGRPAWEKVGVELVDEVHDYEMMKIRVLNGGHAIIAYAAGLLGIEYVHDAMHHPVVRAFLTAVEKREVLPFVKPVGGMTPEAYLEQTIRRFENPGVADTIRRLCFDGSNRQPKFILPSAEECVANGVPVNGLAMVSAMWARYCLGRDENGAVIASNDPNWEALQAAAEAARTNPVSWVEQDHIYGALGKSESFRAAFVDAYEKIATKGVAAAMNDYVNG